MRPATEETLFRICTRAEWDHARRAGLFEGSALDRRDGFIHLSRGAQLAGTLEAHFAGIRGLAVLTIDPALTRAELRWERSRGGELFPHLYGPLPAAAVIETVELPDHPRDRRRTADDFFRKFENS